MINNRRSFIVGIKSTSLNKNEKNFLRKYRPWGVILFSRNIKSLNQTKNLTKEIKKIFKDKKYPILLDQEGGRVNRLKNFLNVDLFTGKFFGDLYLKDIKKFNSYYMKYTEKTSKILKYIGVNINTVPVLDIRRQGSSSIIGDRSFSKKIKVINKIGNICIKSFHKKNIGTVIKHIPGHGLAKVDSHLLTPIIKNTFNYLIKNDFSTFKNKKSFFAMTAHIIYSDIDKLNTATHSKKIIQLIRKKIKFKNLLISDDISMKSLKYSIKKNSYMAFNAGCNLVLHCNGNLKEMVIVGKISPFVDKFIVKKTSQFYKILS
jgi:beta-N-acetylhexosaminidase